MKFASKSLIKHTVLASALLLIGCVSNLGVAQSNDATKPSCCFSDQGTDICFERAKRDMIRNEVLGVSSSPKATIIEMFASDAILPAPGDPNVVGPPTSYLRTWVERMDLLSGGVVTVTLLPVAGAGTIRYTPVFPAHPFAGMYFRCDSPDRRDVYALLPGCVYTGR